MKVFRFQKQKLPLCRKKKLPNRNTHRKKKLPIPARNRDNASKIMTAKDASIRKPKSIKFLIGTWKLASFRPMSPTGSAIPTGIMSGCQKGGNCLPRRNERTYVLLTLLETPRTWFRWNDSDENVKEAPPSVFDAWISQYIEEIENVDRATWNIFQRWGAINACIRGGALRIEQSEEKASIVEVEPEEKASDEPASQAG